MKTSKYDMEVTLEIHTQPMLHERVYLRALTEKGKKALKKRAPDWNGEDPVRLEMMPEEFQAIFPRNLNILIIGPDGSRTEFVRRKEH